MASATLITVEHERDVPAAYRGTAIADLIAYHNLAAPHRRYTQAELLAGMCMDHRTRLRIPDNFAYVMRAAGADFRGLSFQISFAVAVGGARAIAIIGHDQCGMSGLAQRRGAFVAGLVDRAGWERQAAEHHFAESLGRFDIGAPVEFTRAQAQHIRRQYPGLTVAPLFYHLEDGMLSIITEPDAIRS